MKYLLFIALFIQMAFLSPKYHIKRVWLFSKTQYAGNVPALRGGQQPAGHTTTLLCFLEVSRGEKIPDWQWAWFKGNKYQVSMSPASQDSVAVGTKKNTNDIALAKAGPGCKLVELTLSLTGKDTLKQDGFVLEGTFNKQPARLRSDEAAVELSSPLMP
jgi:hypothetical protein